MRSRWVLLGALPAAVALLAGCSSGPGPLGDGGTAGQQCVPAPRRNVLTMGIYVLENSGKTPVTVQSVTLTGVHGLAMTKAWVIPLRRLPREIEAVGAGYPYPPVTWPTWKYRQAVPGAVVPAGKWLNLVFGLTRTTAKGGRSNGPTVSYTAGGNSYSMREQTALALASGKSCP